MEPVVHERGPEGAGPAGEDVDLQPAQADPRGGGPGPPLPRAGTPRPSTPSENYFLYESYDLVNFVVNL